MTAKSKSRREEPPRRAWWASPYLWVLLAAVVPYVTLPAKPALFDANLAIRDNEAVRSGPLGELFEVDFWGMPLDATFASRSYRPLVSATWALQTGPEDFSPRFLHLGDLAIHAGMSVVLCALLLTLMPTGSPLRWIPACLYAVHPLMSEAVSSLVGRADLMASGLLLLAIWLHLRSRSLSRGLLTAGLLGAAMLCKEYAVAFPFLLIGIDVVLWMRDRSAGRLREAVPAWVLSLIVLAAYLLLRVQLIGELGGVAMIAEADQPLIDASMSERLASASFLTAFAAKLLLLPLELSYFYYGHGVFDLPQSFADVRALTGVVLLLALAGLGAYFAWVKREPVPGIAALLFVAPLAPSLNTVSVTGVLFAERFMVLPIAGFALLVAWIVSKFERSATAHRALLVLTLAAVAGSAFLTHQRVQSWSSAESLVDASLDDYPESAKLWLEKGFIRAAAGDHQQAADAFEKSIATYDGSPRAWKALGDARMKLADYGGATEAYQVSVNQSPSGLYVLWVALGQAQLADGNAKDAADSFERAYQIERSPSVGSLMAQAQLRRGRERLAEGDTRGAIALVDRALTVDALTDEGRYFAAQVLARAGERERADAIFEDVLTRNPSVLKNKRDIAVLELRNEKFDAAIEIFEELTVVVPGRAAPWFDLGEAYLQAGRPADAIAPLQRGLAIADNPAARERLRRARRESGS